MVLPFRMIPRSYVWTLTQSIVYRVCACKYKTIYFGCHDHSYFVLFTSMSISIVHLVFCFRIIEFFVFFLSYPNIWSHVFILSWYHDQRMKELQSLQWLINSVKPIYQSDNLRDYSNGFKYSYNVYTTISDQTT